MSFTIEVHPEWAPLGAARFIELTETPGFFTGVRFFRTIKGCAAGLGVRRWSLRGRCVSRSRCACSLFSAPPGRGSVCVSLSSTAFVPRAGS